MHLAGVIWLTLPREKTVCAVKWCMWQVRGVFLNSRAVLAVSYIGQNCHSIKSRFVTSVDCVWVLCCTSTNTNCWVYCSSYIYVIARWSWVSCVSCTEVHVLCKGTSYAVTGGPNIYLPWCIHSSIHTSYAPVSYTGLECADDRVTLRLFLSKMFTDVASFFSTGLLC